MANITIRNKEVDKTWNSVEALLKVDGSKTVTIPHLTRYNIGTNGFALAMVLQPGTSFSLSKRTTGGWALSYASGSLTWTVYNATTSLSVSATVSATVKSHVIPYVTTAGNIGLYVNGEQAAVSGTTITGNFSNTADLTLSGTCLIGLLSVLNTAPSAAEIRQLVNPNFGELALLPTPLHKYTQAYWTMQGKVGNKAYDSVEQFNYAKPNALPALLSANWVKLTAVEPNIAYSQGADYLEIKAVSVPSGNYPGSYRTPQPVPWTYGKTYTLEVDIEIVNKGASDFVGLIFNGSAFFVQKTTAARETVIYTFTPTTGITDAVFYIEGRFYSGSAAMIRVYSAKFYETAVGLAVTANHGTLTGYSDTELGVTDKTTQTARVNFYDKTTTNFWDGSGNELRTGFPDLVNALLIDATHTITFPLAGTVTLSFKGHGVIAYRLKSGQTLTTLETKWLEKNLLYGNPNPAIVRKLDAFYHLGNVNSGTLEVPNLLPGGNNATVSSNYLVVTINSLR